jgi:hypothetical protein
MVIALALALFGALLGQAASADVEAMPAGALLAVLAGWPATWLLRWILAGLASREQGFDTRIGAVRDALGLLLPFALLATLAQLGLGWQATQAFLAAGLMAAAAAGAGAAIRLGAPALPATLVASAWGLLCSGAWIWAWSAAAALQGSAP